MPEEWVENLEKAKKGTPQYEEWLRKYREKHPDAAEGTPKNPNTLKARKALAGIKTATVNDVQESLKNLPKGISSVNIAGVKVVVDSAEDSFKVSVPSQIDSSQKQVLYLAAPAEKLTKKDMGDIAAGINKVVNQWPDSYLPKPKKKDE